MTVTRGGEPAGDAPRDASPDPLSVTYGQTPVDQSTFPSRTIDNQGTVDPDSWFETDASDVNRSRRSRPRSQPGTRSGSGSGSRSGRRLNVPTLVALVAAGLVVVLAAVAGVLWWQHRHLPAVEAIPTDTVPARSWPSGVWTGVTLSPERVAQFGAWRGSKVDTVVTYPAYKTWDELKTSDWHVSVFDSFAGKLVYGLPLLPTGEGSGTLADVAAGKHDDAFTGVADVLLAHHRGNSFVRIGLEANGDWFPWGAGKAGNSPESFKAAFRHVATLLKAKAPQLTIVFDISCGHVMNGQSNRLDSLTKVYPGDDVVDVVGCDHYDQYSTVSRTSQQWANSLHPADAAGLQDVVDFARQHDKKFAVPEWGLAGIGENGGGDNPFYIYEMYKFFAANKDVVAFEDYFNEPDSYLQSAIWGTVQQPKAAAEYAKLW